MKIYNYDPTTKEFLGISEADESPLEPGVFLIPANATSTSPLEPENGKQVVFNEGVWEYKDLSTNVNVVWPEPVPEAIPVSEVERRRYMFQTEADPIFFQWQRGEATEQEWLAKVNEIKARTL